MTGLQYSAPHVGMISVGGHPVVPRQPTAAPRPLQTRAITKHSQFGRDLLVSGLACRYGEIVSDGSGGFEYFDEETRWELPAANIPLKCNHSAYLGSCEITEAPSGLHLRGKVLAPMRQFVGQKKELSIGFTSIEHRTGRDGIRIHNAAILFEVSLVERSAHQTVAALIEAPIGTEDLPIAERLDRANMQHRAVYCS